MGGHRAKNFSWLLGTLLICCSCMVVAFSKAEHQHQQQTVTPSDTDATESTDEDDKELPLFESYLDPGCEMVNFNESGETEISMDDYVFQPVIYLTYTTASIKIKTDSNQYYNLNTTHLPTQRLMSARFDPQTASFKITLAHTLEEVNLNVTGVDDIEGLNITAMTFKYINMTDGNCTNGLPFFKGIDAFVRIPHRERRDLLLLSTRDEGDRSDISGRTSSDYFWICNDVGGITTIKTRFWREGDEFPEDCTSIKANIPHRLTLTYNDDTEIIKMNYTVETGSTGWVQFTGGNYTMVYCLTLCPTSTELTTQPGNVTKKQDKTCDLITDKEILVVIVCIIFLFLIIIDVTAMLMGYVRRRFFYHPPEQEPDNLQWHLNTRPIPAYWQIPPPLPEKTPPSLPEATARRRVMEEKEE